MEKRFAPRWFSPHRHSNATFTTAEDFNDLFWCEVSAIRQKFWLAPAGFGLDLPRGLPQNWQPYLINDSELGSNQVLVFVAVEEFHWGLLKKSVTDSNNPHPLVNFLLNLHFAVPMGSKETEHGLAGLKTKRSLKLPDGLAYTHHNQVVMEFRPDHPVAAPLLYVNGRPNGAGQHAHHWFDNGKLCISPLEGTHRGWQEKNRSVVAWLNLAVAWCVWHYQKFGC